MEMVCSKQGHQAGDYYEVVFVYNGQEDQEGFLIKKRAISQAKSIRKAGGFIKYIGVYDNANDFNLIGEFNI